MAYELNLENTANYHFAYSGASSTILHIHQTFNPAPSNVSIVWNGSQTETYRPAYSSSAATPFTNPTSSIGFKDGNGNIIGFNSIPTATVTINGTVYTNTKVIVRSEVVNWTASSLGNFKAYIFSAYINGAWQDIGIGVTGNLSLEDAMTQTPTTFTSSGNVPGVTTSPQVGWVDTIICFGKGTLITTIDGPCAVEDLRAGALVLTESGEYSEIVWIGHRRLDSADLARHPEWRPIRVGAGALGHGMPEQDLVVSPQHRLLLESKIALRMFDDTKVLVPAKALVGIPGVVVDTECEGADYYHVLLQKHEIIFANGMAAESLLLASVGAKAVPPEALAFFPELFDAEGQPVMQLARTTTRVRPGIRLVERHLKNGSTPQAVGRHH